MRRLATYLTVAALAASAAGCGEDPQTAAEFCADHGGVNAETLEPDGDVTCQDGTEYEAEGSEDSSKKKKKKKR
jgi:hypothetical protein